MTEKALLKFLVVNGLLLLAFTAVWLCPETVAKLTHIAFRTWNISIR